MASIQCDIVILPSGELAKQLIVLSKQFEADDTLFTLDGTHCFPHISLYMTQLKVDDLDKVTDLLAREASKAHVVNLNAIGYGQTKGFLDIEYQRTEVLDALQVAIVHVINPIRDGMREKDKERIPEATGVARDNFEKYGYKYINELFRPHVTITRFVDESGISTSNLPDLESFSGQFTKLGLFEMGDNGTCRRQIIACDLA